MGPLLMEVWISLDAWSWACRDCHEAGELSLQRAVGQLLGGCRHVDAHGAGVRAGPGQHPAVPQEAAGSSPKVAAPGNESASTSGQQIAPEHPSDPSLSRYT